MRLDVDVAPIPPHGILKLQAIWPRCSRGHCNEHVMGRYRTRGVGSVDIQRNTITCLDKW